MRYSEYLKDAKFAADAVVARWRSLAPSVRMKIAVSAGLLAVLAGVAMFHGGTPPSRQEPLLREAGRAHAVVTADVVRLTRAARTSYSAASSAETNGDYKAAAEAYATAARQGDVRALNKLVAMTRAPQCKERSEAAEALARFHSAKATAALKKLSRADFDDESRSPGIFSCSSRKAARKALETQGQSPG